MTLARVTAVELQEKNSQQNIKSVTTLWADILILLVTNQERCERNQPFGLLLMFSYSSECDYVNDERYQLDATIMIYYHK